MPADVAALFVTFEGVYYGLQGVEPWDLSRDARRYAGPHPVVAHPPCKRWGRFWHGSPSKPHQYKLGEDSGCFAAALTAVRNHGGVLEHPAHSHAWSYFGLNRPEVGSGWVRADVYGGWTCYVEQGHYDHASRKPTWLYAVGTERPDLVWSAAEQRLCEQTVENEGYEKARRVGVMATMSGSAARDATPLAFRDLLLGLARSVREKT